MENAIVKAVKETENECLELENKALQAKEDKILQAKEKAKKLVKDFEELKKKKRHELSEAVKIENEKEIIRAKKEANEEIEKLRNTLQEKKQGAISLVISLIA